MYKTQLTYFGIGFVMVTGSNLATIRNSVATIARMIQDCRPKVLHSLEYFHGIICGKTIQVTTK